MFSKVKKKKSDLLVAFLPTQTLWFHFSAISIVSCEDVWLHAHILHVWAQRSEMSAAPCWWRRSHTILLYRLSDGCVIRQRWLPSLAKLLRGARGVKTLVVTRVEMRDGEVHKVCRLVKKCFVLFFTFPCRYKRAQIKWTWCYGIFCAASLCCIQLLMPLEAWQCIYIYCVQCKIVYICAWCHIIIIGILFISLFLSFFFGPGARTWEFRLRANDDETFFHLKIPTPLHLNVNKLTFPTNLAEMPVYTHV